MERKRITMIFGSHGPEDTANLVPFDAAMRRQMAANTDKRVAVLVEDGDMHRFRSEEITKVVADGSMTPSYAFDLRRITNDWSHLADGVPTFRQHHSYTPPKPFTYEQYKLLDSVQADYPGQLHLLPEATFFIWDKEIARAVKRLDAVISLGAKGEFYKDLFVRDVAEWRNANRGRDKSMAAQLSGAMNRVDISSGVSYMGPGHSLAVNDLENGFDITTIYPEQEHDQYYFTPIEDLTREHDDFPIWDYRKMPEGDYWRDYVDLDTSSVALSKTVIWRIASALAKRARRQGEADAPSEQTVRKTVYDHTKDMTAEDAKRFETAVQDANVLAVVRDRLDFGKVRTRHAPAQSFSDDGDLTEERTLADRVPSERVTGSEKKKGK